MTHHAIPDAFATLLDLEVLILGSLSHQDGPPCGAVGSPCDTEGGKGTRTSPRNVLWPASGLEPYDLATLTHAQAACQRYGTDDAERALNLWAMEQAES